LLLKCLEEEFMPEADKQGPADEERSIPWAEGDGVWNVIARLASDLSVVDLVTFFVQNPFACDTAESLAIRIGRKPAQIAPGLAALVEAGFIKRHNLGPFAVYELTTDPQHRQTLQQYVTWLREGYHWTRLAIDGS